MVRGKIVNLLDEIGVVVLVTVLVTGLPVRVIVNQTRVQVADVLYVTGTSIDVEVNLRLC